MGGFVGAGVGGRVGGFVGAGTGFGVGLLVGVGVVSILEDRSVKGLAPVSEGANCKYWDHIQFHTFQETVSRLLHKLLSRNTLDCLSSTIFDPYKECLPPRLLLVYLIWHLCMYWDIRSRLKAIQEQVLGEEVLGEQLVVNCMFLGHNHHHKHLGTLH